MSTRSRRKDSSWSRGGSDEIPLYVALALIAIAAGSLAYLALTGVHIGNLPESAPAPDSTASSSLESSATPTSSPSPASIPVGFVGETSPEWWSASIEAGLVEGASAGPKIGQVGDDMAAITTDLDQVVLSQGQPVVVQVGPQDIIEGSAAAEIDASMRLLWQEVKERGGRPIAALLPPSDVFPGSVVAVNAQIRTSAQTEGIPVLDVTTPVAAPGGTWAEGFSDDGQQPNTSGTNAMLGAALSQLPVLIGSSAPS